MSSSPTPKLASAKRHPPHAASTGTKKAKVEPTTCACPTLTPDVAREALRAVVEQSTPKNGARMPRMLSKDLLAELRDVHALPCAHCVSEMLAAGKKSVSELKWADRLLQYWNLEESDKLLLKTCLGILTGFATHGDPAFSDLREDGCQTFKPTSRTGISETTKWADVIQRVVYAYRFSRPYRVTLREEFQPPHVADMHAFIALGSPFPDGTAIAGEAEENTSEDDNSSEDDEEEDDEEDSSSVTSDSF